MTPSRADGTLAKDGPIRQAIDRFHDQDLPVLHTVRVRVSCRVSRALCAVLALTVVTACKPAGTNYYPLEAPRWWHYAVRESILDEQHQSRYLMQNAGLAPGLDNTVYLQTAQTGSADFLRYHGAGVERIASLRPGMHGPQPDPKPRVVLPEALTVGTRWQVRSTIALAESRTFEPRDRIIPRRLPVELDKKIVADDAELEIAAGHFQHCLLIEGQGLASVPTDRGNGAASVAVAVSEWYAPGVGLIKLERRESSDSSFLKAGEQSWELLDYGD
jgi:hypothetical protein